MAPHFETVRSFADVQITDGVNTTEFLDASDGLVKLFDLMGNAIFGFVQMDIRNNITGVRNRYNSAQESSQTLESLVQSEANDGGKKDARACLVRLTRGLAFTHTSLSNVHTSSNPNLYICFKKSYDEVLKHHHNFMIQSVVYVALRTVPHRHEFYTRLVQDGSREKFDAEFTRWLDGLGNVVAKLRRFLEEGGWGKV